MHLRHLNRISCVSPSRLEELMSQALLFVQLLFERLYLEHKEQVIYLHSMEESNPYTRTYFKIAILIAIFLNSHFNVWVQNTYRRAVGFINYNYYYFIIVHYHHHYYINLAS